MSQRPARSTVWRQTQAVDEIKWPPLHRRQSIGVRVFRVEHDNICLWQNCGPYRRQERPLAFQPCIPDLPLLRQIIHEWKPFGDLIGFNPTKLIILINSGQITRQVSQYNEHCEARFGCKIDDGPPRRSPPGAPFLRTFAIQCRVSRPRETPQSHALSFHSQPSGSPSISSTPFDASSSRMASAVAKSFSARAACRRTIA